MVKDPVQRLLRVALAVIIAGLSACGDHPQEPARVLSGSIRALDLVTWVREGAISPATLDWTAIDAAHDRYLLRVLADRVVARARITELYRTIDDSLPHTPRDQWNSARSSAAIARDFEAMLAREDQYFFNEIASARGMSHALSGYLLERRALNRPAQRLALAAIQTNLTDSFAQPVAWLLASLPADGAVVSHDRMAWTRDASRTLAPLADAWWDEMVKASLLIIEAQIPPLPHVPPDQAKADADAKLHKAATGAVSSASQYLRAAFDSLDPTLTKSVAEFPEAVRLQVRERVLATLKLPVAIGETDRCFAAALLLPATPEATAREVMEQRERWRRERLVLGGSLDPDSTPLVAAAHAAKARLLALFPSEGDRTAIATISVQHQPMPEQTSDPDDDAVSYEGAPRYTNWMRVGLVPAAPSEADLRALARMSGLDRDQEDLLIADAMADWETLLVENNRRMEAEEESAGKEVEQTLDNPTQFDALVRRVLQECIQIPVESARATDEAIAETIRRRAEAFHGRAEPAATLWTILRCLPSPPFWAQAGNSELRCFCAVARGTAAQLAIDRELSAETRQVLVDLVFEHRDNLLKAGNLAVAARLAAVGPLAKAAVAGRHDSAIAKRGFAEGVIQFLRDCQAWTTMQDDIVSQAAALIPARDAQALRYRRALLQYPEILDLPSTRFSRDGQKARELAGDACAINDAALEFQLRDDDLALVDAIMSALAKRKGAQPTNSELATLALTDEELVEQSARRIDRAVRVRRNVDLAPR